MIVKLLWCIPIFFILGFIQGKVIEKGNWIIEGKIPNHWIGHSVWGIFWVVTTCLFLEIISLKQWVFIFLIFLASFPGIYLSGIKQWYKCNLSKQILRQLNLIYQKLV